MPRCPQVDDELLFVGVPLHVLERDADHLEHNQKLHSRIKCFTLETELLDETILQLLVLGGHVVEGEIGQLSRVMVNGRLLLLNILRVSTGTRQVLAQKEYPLLDQKRVLVREF